MLMVHISWAQQTVTGQVLDAAGGDPLIGVNIIEQGTANGTITDLDGNYMLTVSSDAVLEFSFTGFSTQSIAVDGQSTINVNMAEEATALNEVVVVGYTTRKKGELTGSVATLDNEIIERTTNKDVAKSLAGKVPGLIVSDRGGYPGSDSDITLLIRGKSTLGNNAPLVLIDGIPTESFSHLAPTDIESLSVLKDGAAAIYGARAANGVILITTKRGRDGKPVINVGSTYSSSSLSRRPDLMDAEQYAIYRNEAAERYGLELPFSDADIQQYASGALPSTDWYDATIADSAPEWRHTLSVSGGADRVNYFVSGDYIDQEGLFRSGGVNFEQYQLRSNIDIKVHDKVKLGVDVSGRFGDRNEPGVDQSFIYKHIYTNEPTEPAIYDNGLMAWGGENGANPVIMSGPEGGFVNRIDNNLRSRLALDVDLDWIAEGLSFRSYAGIRRWTTDTKSWYTPWTVYTFQEGTGEYVESAGFSQQGATNILRENFWKFDELMLNSTIHYDQTFGQHTIRGFVGTERFTSSQRNFWAERRDFPSNDVPELFAGADEGQISNGGSSESARLNYFGSLSYDFDKKYFIDLTLRHDGSSNFGPGNRFGTFPGVALAWSIADEPFMESTGDWLSALKLRTSWALMGNDRIAPFQFLTRYNYGGGANTQPNSYIFGTNGTRYNGYASANVPNPDITWEKAKMMNVGLNFALLDYKFTADVNYFYQKREDILITRNASIPDVAGITLPQENLGKVDNFGYEIALGYNDKVGKVNYNLGFNFTQAKNEIVFMDEAANVSENLRREGFPIDSYIVYPTNGIFQTQAEIDAAPAVIEGTVPGEPYYIDTNGDGQINAGDRTRVYSSNVPEIQYGFLGGLSVGSFDMNFLFQGQANAEMLVFFDQNGALPQYVFDQRWTPENTGGRYPRAFGLNDKYSGSQNDVDNFQGADFYLHDASFLRLKELELGYTFSQEQTKFGKARIFFRGLNLSTMFSEVYDLGLDPEAAGYNNFRNSTYPSLKSYSFGVNLTL